MRKQFHHHRWESFAPIIRGAKALMNNIGLLILFYWKTFRTHVDYLWRMIAFINLDESKFQASSSIHHPFIDNKIMINITQGPCCCPGISIRCSIANHNFAQISLILRSLVKVTLSRLHAKYYLLLILKRIVDVESLFRFTPQFCQA